MIFASLFLFVGVALAQTTVTGTVVSQEDGEPVVGARVMLKDTQIGTITDAYGRFTLQNVPNSAKILQVSYIGMQTSEEAIKPNMFIEMKSDQETLDEVMVVAFGTAKKSAFTGSATVIGSEELSRQITTNVANALVGTTPGLQMRGSSGSPGASQGSINIRGIASLYADTEPLVIVDGAPYSASLSNIPQEDVESITVLKDAASAALYGARGAAGVIIITTKTGQNKKATVSVDVKWGANSRAVQDYETIDNPGQYYETVYKQYYNYYSGLGQDLATANANANTTMMNHLVYNIYDVPEGQNLIGTNGRLNPYASLGRTYTANGETYYLTADNWRDDAYSSAFRQEYNMNVSGANDKGSFYASLGYLDEDGVIEYSGYKRVSARLKADYQVKKWLKVGANVGYVNSSTTSNPNLSASGTGSTDLLFYTTHIAPIYPIYVRTVDANGNPVVRTDEHGNPQYDYGVAASNYPGLSRPFLSTGNPFGSNRYNEVTNKGQQLNGTFTADINFTDFLKFNATSTINWGHSNYSDYETGLYGPKVSVGGQIDKYQSDNFRQNHVQTLTYFDRFGLHDINVMIGHEYYKEHTTYLYAYAQGLFSEDIKEINAAANPALSASSYQSGYNVEGWFGSAQYNYDEKYFGSLSYRRDASSRFDKDHRWGNFWSFGAAWLMNKEKWFSNVTWLDELKIKASVGQQGNDNIGSWAYIDLYSLTPASETEMSADFYRMGNEKITWETTTNWNVGIEFSLFKNRLSGSLDVYNKKTTDLLFWLSIPESAGTRGYYDNIGDIRNKGVELTLNGTLVRRKNIEWNVYANISHNKDKILSLPESKITELGGYLESSMWFKVGGSLYNYCLADYAGPDPETGKALYWVDANLGEGVTNQPGHEHSYTTDNVNYATRYEQGSSLPKAFGGFGTTFTAYGVDVSMTFDYQLGGHVYDNTYQSLMSNNETASDAGQALHKDILKSWSADNTSSNIPRFQYGDQYTAATSNRWLTSAKYLNFQSFTVGYTLPKNITNKWTISKLRVYVAGENLCFWSVRKGLDPRYAYDGNSYNNAYSPVRTVMGGIQVTF